MTTAEVEALMKERFKGNEWAYLPQVRNATGMAAQIRTADALAMSLFPSRGLELHGFEIKCSRADWLRELKDASKAEAIAQYCDRWWIVAGSKDIVNTAEIPTGWGLLIPCAGTLRAVKNAPKLDAVPIDRAFLAGLLRKAAEYVPAEELIAKARREGFESGASTAKSGSDYELRQARHELECVKANIAAFEEKSGLRIDQWNAGNMGAAVRTLMSVPKGDLLYKLRQDLTQYEKVLFTLKRHIEEIDANVPESVENLTPTSEKR
jgi:hypothetical protein